MVTADRSFLFPLFVSVLRVPLPSPPTKQIVLLSVQSWAVSDGASECLMERGSVRGGVGASQVTCYWRLDC